MGAWAGRINPCGEVGGPTQPLKKIDANSGFLVLQLSRPDVQGKRIFEGSEERGTLPALEGRCTWLPLSAGRHQIRIESLPQEIEVTIRTRRTEIIKLSAQPASLGSLPARFAVRLIGQPSDFPADSRTGLLPLIARAETQELESFDLADAESQTEPQAESAIPAVLETLSLGQQTCEVQRFQEEATLHFVLFLSHDSGGYRVRAYNTAYGAERPAAELREGSEAAAECRMKKGLQYPRCLLYTALEAAQNRRQICLKVDTQPADAQVRLTALSGTGQALGEPRSLPARQSVPREQVLFGTPSTDPQQFRLSVEHPRFLPQERLIDFSQTMLQSVSIKLDPRPVAAVPLYKKWWLWQSLATAVVIGVTGTVAGIYTNDRGRQ